MSRIKGILFDLDGTLVDSVADLADSVNFALGSLGLPLHTDEEIRGFVGDGVQKLIRRSLGETHIEKFEETFAIFMAHYGEHCTDRTVLYPGVAEALSELDGKYFLGVLTNKSLSFSKKILSALKIASRFSEVIGGDSLTTRKPDPAGIFHIAGEWSVDPGELVMVGDHATDIEVGRRAGCATVFIEGGIGVKRELGPDHVIRSMGELPGLLERLTGNEQKKERTLPWK